MKSAILLLLVLKHKEYIDLSDEIKHKLLKELR